MTFCWEGTKHTFQILDVNRLFGALLSNHGYRHELDLLDRRDLGTWNSIKETFLMSPSCKRVNVIPTVFYPAEVMVYLIVQLRDHPFSVNDPSSNIEFLSLLQRDRVFVSKSSSQVD